MLLLKKTIPLLLLVINTLVPAGLWAQSISTADSLAALGDRFNNEAKYKEAEAVFEQALAIYQSFNDTTKWIRYAMEYGEALVDQGKFDAGLKLFHSLESMNHSSITASYRAKLQSDIGWTYDRTGQFDVAIRYYHKSLAIANAVEDSSQLATVYNNLGNAVRDKGEYRKALEYLKEAVKHYEAIGTPFRLAIGYNNLARSYESLTMYDEAFAYYRKSIRIREEVGNPDLLATGYHNLAGMYSKQGDFNRALSTYEKSLTFRRKTGNPSKTARTLANIGSLYRQLGNTGQALFYFRDALELNRQYNGPEWISTTLSSLGGLYREQDDHIAARQHYLEALELRKGIENPNLIANSLFDLARTEQALGDLAAAKKYFKKALAIAEQEDLPLLKIQAYTRQASFLHETGKADSALSSTREAYRLSQNLPPYMQLWPTVRLARAFHRTGSDSAFYYGERAIAYMEIYRTRAGFLSMLKAGFFKDFASFYCDLAAWYAHKKKNYDRAFNLLEASKARSFVDELAVASADLNASLPEEVRMSIQEQSKHIEELFTKLQDQTDSVKKQEIEKQLRSAELEYAAYMNRTSNEHPGFKHIAYPSPISLSETQALLDDKTAILEYALADDGLLIFLITADQVEIRYVDIIGGESDEQELTRLVERFRDRIMAHAPIEELRSESAPLFKKLIHPFMELLSSYPNIMIVPDGALAYLPFEALSYGDRLLIEDFNVKYVPSMTTFSLLKQPGSASGFQKDLLALAGSNFNAPRGMERKSRSYDPLPATIAEVDSIASKFRTVSLYKEGNFSESFVKELLTSDYRFVHLATHGIINEDHPNLSGLVLSAPGSVETGTGSEDGMLRSSEIYQLAIAADMVVLSACNSGMGKMVKGEGILGLQRSFFYAGVPTVTVSLWNVYDRSTAYLMNEFYSFLLKNPGPGASESWWTSFLRWIGWTDPVPYGNTAMAMRKAKLNMIQHPLYHHPIYWAPFIVVGR